MCGTRTGLLCCFQRSRCFIYHYYLLLLAFALAGHPDWAYRFTFECYISTLADHVRRSQIHASLPLDHVTEKL
jgi:hypothetical protein